MPTARSRHVSSQSRGYLGKVPQGVYHVLLMAHEVGFAISANIAREFALDVALAASLGWISIIRQDGATALRYWNITSEGLTALNHREAT